LSRIVRHLLANLVDTDAREPREFLIKRRGTARLPASKRDHDVAYFIAWRVQNRELMKNAKTDASVHFKIAKATVNRAWRKHRKAMTDRVRRLLAELKKPYIPHRRICSRDK
jgi:hypothetical protein